MLEKTNSKISVTRQCELLEINRSSLYYKPISETTENLEIMRLLDKQYLETPFYGQRKLKILLRKKGWNVNKKRVRRLMKIINWRTIYREPRTTISDKEHKKYPYLLRDLEINRNNQVWTTDITYIPMAKGFMYLMAIMDISSRFVINWSISNSMSADWCSDVLKDTLEKHGNPEIFNTDQGSQFTSEIFTKTLIDSGIKISMDGKGRALDNIYIERLWRSVKYENIYLNVYENGLDLYSGLKKYFEFYNNERFHESLEYEVPKQKYFQAA
jgi:putative transposase